MDTIVLLENTIKIILIMSFAENHFQLHKFVITHDSILFFSENKIPKYIYTHEVVSPV